MGAMDIVELRINKLNELEHNQFNEIHRYVEKNTGAYDALGT